MIPDRLFKSLNHRCKGFELFLNGQSLEPGYKPDVVLRKANNFIIIESENSSSRKTFVGGMMKAAHFLKDKNKGKLIFVMVPKKNTTALSLAIHLKPYLKWINTNTNLKSVYVIEAGAYYNNNAVIELFGNEFIKNSIKV